MQLLNVITARAIWLFDLAELNPTGKAVHPAFLTWLKDKYNLEKDANSPTQPAPNQPMNFLNGKFIGSNNVELAINLSFYNDGLVATGLSSTRDSEAFLREALSIAVKDFGLTFRDDMIRRKLYLSEMNVRSDKKLAGVNPELAELADKISTLIPGNLRIPYEPGGISFWPNQSAPPFIAAFQLERKVNTPLGENKYYSRAPLHTDDHLAVLSLIENRLMA